MNLVNLYNFLNPRKIKTLAAEGFKIAKRDLFGREYKKYKGNAVEICKQTIADRWNGTFFEGGSSLFNGQFWIRDFSLSLEGILQQGYREKAKNNLVWALEVFEKSGKIATTILGRSAVVDFWRFSADSLPFLLYSLNKAKVSHLAVKYKGFLNSEIEKYFRNVFDAKTGLVKQEPFSTPKDVVMRKRTCVANSFMVFLSDLLEHDFPHLANPFKGLSLRKHFVNAFWNKEEGYFRNDLMDGEGNVVSADANVIPHWLGIVGDKEKRKASIDAIKREGLDRPFPLKYHSFYDKTWMKLHLLAMLLTPNYQGNSVWTMFGPIYIELESEFYPMDSQKHLKKYLELIEEYQAYIEVFEPDGKSPLKGKFGHVAETGMLWAAMIPALVEKFGVNA